MNCFINLTPRLVKLDNKMEYNIMKKNRFKIYILLVLLIILLENCLCFSFKKDDFERIVCRSYSVIIGDVIKLEKSKAYPYLGL
jgi:hypothetical protein